MLAADAEERPPLMEGYTPTEGRFDELVDAEGRVRPHWLPMLKELGRDGPAALARRFALADQHLKNSGVFYRVYDPSGGGERPWPLSHLPLVIPEAEWRSIEAGIAQRARLVEKILADLYGGARLVAEGALPAAVVAGNPAFLRPLVGTTPRGGESLVVYAADLGRAPDGRWWLLGDRAQAPSGMGYALENRLAIATALPGLSRDMHVERLAGFFQALRASLAAKAGRENSRIGLITPGPANETYFEHAYLARYLGFLLVEGGDLTVQDGAVYVRTIEGLKRIDVLMRRLDADFADPLEFTASSRIGVPGLVRAVRAGAVALANGLGAGLIEAPAMLAFIPALARRLLGEDLVIPNIATWWCGDDEARRVVEERRGELELAAAFPRRSEAMAAPVPDRAALEALLANRGAEVVGREAVKLATMPVWSEGRLVPRPFTLRVFAVSTGDGGWTVMRGGFCRVAEGGGAETLSMQQGGRSADVWVTAQSPVEPVTLLPPPGRVPIRRRLGYLPSRAADNLFWLGRYLERAETTFRVVRALCELDVETAGQTTEATRRLARLLAAWGAVAEKKPLDDIDLVIAETLTGEGYGAVPALVRAAARTASVIRERLSPDATRALDDLRGIVEDGAGQDPTELAEAALRVLAALSGLAQENMNRISGWRFLQIGRRIERGVLTTAMAKRLADQSAPENTLDALLKVTDSRITYRARYLLGTLRLPVLDLIVLDDGNPRSVAFQLQRLVEHVGDLPGATREGEISPPGKTVRLLRTMLETSEARDVDNAMLDMLGDRLMGLSNEVTARYFGQGEAEDERPESLG